MRLLIVDDEETTCLGMQARIREMCFSALNSIDIAYSAEEALSFARNQQIDILLTDIRMVEMNGLELIYEMKTLYPRARCIIMTAYANFSYAHQAIKLGIQDFLLKPFSREELYQAIDKSIRQSLEERNIHPENVDKLLDPIGWAKQYVQCHLEDEINMAQVANELNLSYSYFSKIFKKKTGISFSTYITDAKLKKAVQLLAEGYRTAEIAHNLGYLNTQTFTRAFERYWGCTPHEYRKSIR